jgi:diguanylate cyclase (GGDEF)-like protein
MVNRISAADKGANRWCEMAKATRRGDGKAGASTRRTRLSGTRRAAAKSAAPKTAPASRAKNPRTAAGSEAANLVIAKLTKRLAQAQRYIARLEAHADTDFLLDIPNRRGFERELNRSIAYVKRYRASAALLIVDVDRLKPINDGHGHAAGDHVLKTIVGVLSQNIRESDMIARLGGDEFGLLLWNLPEADALAKAAALESAIDEAFCEYRGRRMPLGVSIGVTVLGADDEAARVLERADRAMYARKHSRRGTKPFVLRR